MPVEAAKRVVAEGAQDAAGGTERKQGSQQQGSGSLDTNVRTDIARAMCCNLRQVCKQGRLAHWRRRWRKQAVFVGTPVAESEKRAQSRGCRAACLIINRCLLETCCWRQLDHGLSHPVRVAERCGNHERIWSLHGDALFCHATGVDDDECALAKASGELYGQLLRTTRDHSRYQTRSGIDGEVGYPRVLRWLLLLLLLEHRWRWWWWGG
mmetsp:Transcript_8216/g.21527  ORF Transcript_8216/g.21527 Transcript_8216/m.21527 type:complete len:210 (+) Transcript_8216:555-1184(+)